VGETAALIAYRWLGRLVIGALACVGVMLVALTIIVPKLTNGAALTVLTGSMRPAYPPGSLVIVRPVDTSAIDVGDVITYQSSDGSASITTHRVVEIGSSESGEPRFVTKGDANDGVDRLPVSANAVHGKVWFGVPHLGAVRNSLSSPVGLAVIAGVIGLAMNWDRVTAQWSRLLRRTAHSAKDSRIGGAVDGGTEPEPISLSVVGLGAAVRTTACNSVDDPLQQQLLLLRLSVSADERTGVLCLSHALNARVLDIDAESVALSIAGTPEQLDEVEMKLGIYRVADSARTSVVAVPTMTRSGPSRTQPRRWLHVGNAEMRSRQS
jgi:signal peptidase I